MEMSWHLHRFVKLLHNLVNVYNVDRESYRKVLKLIPVILVVGNRKAFEKTAGL